MPDFAKSSYDRYLHGDESALEELIRTYSDALTRFAYGYVGDVCMAEEMMEDAFADVLSKGKHFADENHFRAYLYKAVRNRSITYLRRRNRHISLEELEQVASQVDVEMDFIRRQQRQTLYACMQELPQQYRQVLTLIYLDGFSIENAGVIMGRSKKQMYNLLSRAKPTLKGLLIKEGVSYEDL